MRLVFCVRYHQSAIKQKVRAILNDIYGNTVEEETHGIQYPKTTFFPLTGIYGLRGKYGLDDFSVRVIYLSETLTKVSLFVPDFSGTITDLYVSMSPTVVAWHFKRVDTELRRSLRKYIINPE